MGWWSPEVLGGDYPLDLLAYLERLLDVEELYPLADLTGRRRERAREAVTALTCVDPFEAVIVDIAGSGVGDPLDVQDYRVTVQVLAALVMAVGAPMPPVLRERAIEAARTDDTTSWVDPQERRAYMHDLDVALGSYTDGTPVLLPTR